MMITIDQLNFHYKKRSPLFSNLELDVSAGNICGLLGKNGAGKTTLLKLIAGLTYPKSGSLTVNGFNPADRRPAFLADLYLVPEEFYVPAMKINTFEKVYGAFYPKFSREQFDTYLREFEVDRSFRMDKLSYGQKKKVLLSFGLATNTSLLILDEPTNGLDIPSKSRFRKLLAGSIDDDKCYVISTHQVRDMINLIDPVIILEDGKIIFQASIEEITNKLHFGIHFQESLISDALYAERTPGGYLAVTPNITGEETEVDLEVLFNAVVENKARVQELFHRTLKTQ
jgi:ABC-2 type transport system ATP-binding protein